MRNCGSSPASGCGRDRAAALQRRAEQNGRDGFTWQPWWRPRSSSSGRAQRGERCYQSRNRTEPVLLEVSHAASPSSRSARAHRLGARWSSSHRSPCGTSKRGTRQSSRGPLCRTTGSSERASLRGRARRTCGGAGASPCRWPSIHSYPDRASKTASAGSHSLRKRAVLARAFLGGGWLGREASWGEVGAS